MRLFFAFFASSFSLLLPLNAGLLGASNPVNVQENIEWTKNSINSHARLQYQNPTGVIATTTWQITASRGCQFDLKQTFHRESHRNVITAEGPTTVLEEENKIYSFDLADLKPKQLRAVTAEEAPYLVLSAATDLFQVHSEHEVKTLRASGEVKSSSSWSEDQRARSLSIYFGAGKTDNTKLVRDAQRAMRTAIDYCRSARATHTETE